MCERERVYVWGREIVCVCACERERVCMCGGERDCVCVREKVYV